MPYLWAASLKGTITARGVETDVDAGFRDILQSLRYAAIGQVELAKGRGLILADTVLLRTEVGGSAERSRLGPLGFGTITGKVDAKVGTLTWFQELTAGYRVYERRLCSDGDEPRRMTVDALAGIRYYLVDVDLDVDAEVSVTGPRGHTVTRRRSASVSEREDWIDPLIGTRVRYDVTSALSVALKGDIGGFGVGSEMSWSASALARYRFSDCWSVVGGYKVLDIDYSNGRRGLDARMAGPVAGIAYETSF